MDKLTIYQLKNYLGTGLKSFATFSSIPLHREMDHLNMYSFIYNDTRAKLMFFRLSDLDKFIPELGFVPLDKIKEYWKAREVSESSIDLDCNDLTIEVLLRGCDYASERDDSKTWIYFSHIFHIYNLLFQWHFWVFDQSYFEKGLIIDKLKTI